MISRSRAHGHWTANKTCHQQWIWQVTHYNEKTRAHAHRNLSEKKTANIYTFRFECAANHFDHFNWQLILVTYGIKVNCSMMTARWEREREREAGWFSVSACEIHIISSVQPNRVHGCAFSSGQIKELLWPFGPDFGGASQIRSTADAKLTTTTTCFQLKSVSVATKKPTNVRQHIYEEKLQQVNVTELAEAPEMPLDEQQQQKHASRHFTHSNNASDETKRIIAAAVGSGHP